MRRSNAEAERAVCRLFEDWLPTWKAENPDREKPSGNDAFMGFYLGVLVKNESPLITRDWEWQEIHACLKRRGFLDG